MMKGQHGPSEKERDLKTDMMEEHMPRTELLNESQRLAECLLSDDQVDALLRTAEGVAAGIDNPDTDVDFSSFWQCDASIGGIGGYCLLPFMKPFGNPFPHDIARQLFRPIQYAAAQIIYHNGPNTARATVEFSGMHLEAVAKFWVKKSSSVLDAKRYEKLPLGNSIFALEKQHLATDGLAECLDTFLVLYDMAKHEVTHDEERRMFSIPDALVDYLSSRILSTRILKPYYDEILHGIPDYEKNFPEIRMNTYLLSDRLSPEDVIVVPPQPDLREDR